METLTIALGLATLFLFQANLFKKSDRKLSLAIPIIFFLFSLGLVSRFNGYVDYYGRTIELFDMELIILNSLGILLFLNIPTVILLTIYYKDQSLRSRKKIK